jgi:hypothetical protein
MSKNCNGLDGENVQLLLYPNTKAGLSNNRLLDVSNSNCWDILKIRESTVAERLTLSGIHTQTRGVVKTTVGLWYIADSVQLFFKQTAH